MVSYPLQNIADYRAGRTTRQQFIRRFANWQKARGVDYATRSEFHPSVTGGFLGLTYRGQNAVLDGKVIAWLRADGINPKTGCTRFRRYEAETIGEFRRNVDHAIHEQLRGNPWS